MIAVAALIFGLTSTPELSQLHPTTIPKTYVVKIHIKLFAQLLSDHQCSCFAISAPNNILQAIQKCRLGLFVGFALFTGHEGP
jgi:hypothetical protein